jgi:arsenite methyltransferase
MTTSSIPRVPMLRLDTLWFQVAGTLCNIQCAHCFISCSPANDTHKMMSRDQVRVYLEEARRLGVKEFYFTGGEPFLNREMPEILEDSLAAGPCTVLTNGMLINEKLARRLAEIRARSAHALEFRVSLDGSTAEANDKVRGRGVFDRAIRGIRCLRAEGFEPIITSTQTDESIPAAEFRRGFEALAQDLGYETPRLKILPPLFMGEQEKNKRGYRPHERVTEDCFKNFPWENLLCSTARMATAEGVYVCPILVNEPGARMGGTLAETLRPFPLAYQACYTCRVGGLSCNNDPEVPTVKKTRTLQLSEVTSMESSCCNGNGKAEAAPSCCAAEPASGAVSRQDVQEFYGEAGARPQKELCCPTAYAKEEISHIPPEVMEVSYGCGSPVTLAGLKPGETHVDLGSGGGVDCFIAAKAVGKTGRVIGVDMTAEMMLRAVQNAGKVAKALGYHNVEFRHGYLEEVPVDDETADLVTSNCVVNLSPDKKKVFREIRRALKHGGRFVISDIVSEGPVPEAMQNDKQLWGECISGALTEQEFSDFAKECGFYGLETLKRTFYREVNGCKFWSVTLRGWKFNKGEACVYAGQFATYLGPYSQVSDDEGHAYSRGVPFEVCTDTAAKLQRPPYAGEFIVTDSAKQIDGAASCCPPADGNGASCC